MKKAFKQISTRHKVCSDKSKQCSIGLKIRKRKEKIKWWNSIVQTTQTYKIIQKVKLTIQFQWYTMHILPNWKRMTTPPVKTKKKNKIENGIWQIREIWLIWLSNQAPGTCYCFCGAKFSCFLFAIIFTLPIFGWS